MENMFDGLAEGVTTSLIVAVILGFILSSGIHSCAHKNDIESKVRIIPTLKIISDGRTSDTTFIYNKP